MGFYDDPYREVYLMPSAAFGATTDTLKIIGPKGKKGLVRDIEVHLTADAVGTTSVPEIDVGNASGDYSYARFRLGSAAGAGYAAASGPYRASQVGGNTLMDDSPSYEDFPGHVKMGSAYIPADTPAVITRTQGVGGTPAGTGIVRVTIDWF